MRFRAAFGQAMVQAPLSTVMHTPSQRRAGIRRLRRRRREVRPAPGMAASLSTEHRPMLACCPFVCMRCSPKHCYDDLRSAVRCAAERPVAYLVLARSIAHRRDCLRKPPVRSADRGRLAGEPQRGGASKPRWRSMSVAVWVANCRSPVAARVKRSPRLVSKHSGPGATWTACIRSAQVVESDFLVSQASPTFPRV